MNRLRENRRRVSLRVESLERLTLLSGFAPLATTPTGTVEATYRTFGHVTEALENFRLDGRGEVMGIGQVKVSGKLHMNGLTNGGSVGGTLVLTNGRGSLTLSVTAPSSIREESGGTFGNFYPIPYTVTRATGVDRGLRGTTGQVAFTMNPDGTDTLPLATAGKGHIAVQFNPNQVFLAVVY